MTIEELIDKLTDEANSSVRTEYQMGVLDEAFFKESITPILKEFVEQLKQPS